MNTKFKFISTVVLLVAFGMLVGCSPQAAPEPEPEAFIPSAQETGQDALVIEESADEALEALEEAVEEAYPAPAEGEVADAVVDEAVVDEAVAAYPYPAPEGDSSDFVETEGLESVDPVAEPAGDEITFVIDPSASQVSYSVEEEFFNREVQFVTAVGTTSVIDGSLSVALSGGEPSLTGGEISVDISTLESDSNRRDNAIRNDWLESARFPTATFVPSAIENFSGDYTDGAVTFDLVGDLTVREVTNPVTFNVTASLEGETLRGTATALVMMVDYGFDPPDILNILTVTDGVTLTIDLVAQQS